MADTLRVSNLSSTSGSLALTINNDQSVIGYGEHWNVGNIGSSGPSGNWSTFGVNWYGCSGFGSNSISTYNFKQCCISWNGQYVLFTCINNGAGPYFSNNGAYAVATVSPTASGVGNFYGCAMSASGQYILVANLTTVYLSSNFLTMPLSAVYSSTAYTSVLSVTSTTNSLAMSASGQYAVFAYSASATTGGIYLSSNYGATWALVSGTNYPWQSVSMSSSGQYITACCNGTPNNIYISSNGGATFSLPSTSLSSVAGWTSVKVSSSGQYQVAAATNYVYYSSDYGMTWTASSMSSSITWGCVAVSPSGKYMVASNNAATSYIYTNSNYGVGAWTQQANGSNQYSICLAVSSTGTIAYASNGNTITASALTTAAAPLLAPALSMGTNPNATANAMLSVYTANASGSGTSGGGVIVLGSNYAPPATGLFGGAGDKVILYPGSASSYPYSLGVDASKFYLSVPTGSNYWWYVGGTVRMILDSSGNLGIGTSSPASQLHLYSTTASSSSSPYTALSLMNTNTGNSGASVAIDISTYNTVGYSPGARIAAYDSNYASDIAFLTKSQGAIGNSLVERMRITGAGYVGIGTTNPDDILSLYNSTNLSFRISNATSGLFQIGLANGPGQYSGNAASGDSIIRAISGNLMLQTGSGNSAVYINSSNNVGIGNAAPSMRLSVGSYGGMMGGVTFTLSGSSSVSSGLVLPGGGMFIVSISTAGNIFGGNNQWYYYGIVLYNVASVAGYITPPISSNNVTISCPTSGNIVVTAPGGSGSYTWTANAIRLC